MINNTDELSSTKKSVIIKDTFNGPGLPHGWGTSPGRGEYSLSARHGYLRYTIDADHTAREAGSGQGYAKALWLVRSFVGDSWELKTDVTYNMRPDKPTNNRNMHFVIRTAGVKGKVLAAVHRSVGENDSNKGSNALTLVAGEEEKTIYFPNSPKALPIEDWRVIIRRHRNRITVVACLARQRYECTSSLRVVGHDQEIEIQGDGWHGSNNPAGYADFAYIDVDTIGSPIPVAEGYSVENIEGVGRINAQKLEAVGIETVDEMAKANPEKLGKDTGISLAALYTWKKRAMLATECKINRKIFENILNMPLGKAVDMPEKEIGKVSGLSETVIRELKMKCAAVLISLDNDVAESMQLEQLCQ